MRAWARPLVMGSLLLASRARAEDLRGTDTLVYEAPAGCPDRAAFIARIAARMKSADASAGNDANAVRAIRVRIEVLPNGARAELESADARGEHSKRTIQGATCAEVADGAALIAALAAGSGSAQTSATSGTGTESASGSASASASASGSVSESEPEPESESEPEPDPDRDSESDSGTASGAASAAGDHFALTASILALTRILPTLEPAAQLTLSWSHSISSAFLLSLLAGPRFSTTSRASDAQGNADLALYGATVAACASARLQHDTWRASGCLALEPGLLAAHGSDTRNARDENRAWFALGPGLGLAWAGAAPLVVDAGVELQIPLVRDRFKLGAETVFRPPSVGLRAGIGVGVRL